MHSNNIFITFTPFPCIRIIFLLLQHHFSHSEKLRKHPGPRPDFNAIREAETVLHSVPRSAFPSLLSVLHEMTESVLYSVPVPCSACSRARCEKRAVPVIRSALSWSQSALASSFQCCISILFCHLRSRLYPAYFAQNGRLSPM